MCVCLQTTTTPQRLLDLYPPFQLPPDSPSPARDSDDFFICHRGETKATVARVLHAALARHGKTAFLDERDDSIRVGEPLCDEIACGLHTCRHGVVLLSPSFFDSLWCVCELRTMIARALADPRFKIICVRQRRTRRCSHFPVKHGQSVFLFFDAGLKFRLECIEFLKEISHGSFHFCRRPLATRGG